MKRVGMNNILWSLFGILLLLSSCKDESMGTGYGDGHYREVELPLSYKVSTSVETRTLSANFEKSCIYQFKSDGILVTKVDLKSTDDKVVLYVPYTEGVELKCVFIANASIDEVEVGGEVTNWESLLSKHLVINTNYNPGSDDKVLMSGVATVYSSTTSLSFTLCPNVAKFNLKILPYNKDNYNKLFSVQMRHVHNKIHYAHHAFTDDQKQNIHAKYAHIDGTAIEGYGQDLVTYESISLPDPNEYDSKYPFSCSWYVPHNWLGDKKPLVDDNQHTLFVISYERHGDWKTIKIPIYLAQRSDKNNDGKIYEDEVVSYNVEAGVIYNVTVNLDKFIEITEENKTVNLEKYVEFPANTNCHLLNPATTGVGTVYSIPVSRAWEYWGNRLPENTKWQAEIIWQDINEPVLTFCNADGTVTGGTQQITYTGEGKNENEPNKSRFFLKLIKNRAGNAVVGVKAIDGEFAGKYIWSWHLWITDYNPNVAPTPSTVYPQNVFNVTGGEVHRYRDPFDETGKTVKQVFWSDPANEDVYIMDRNLGAYSANPADNSANNVFRNAGMYYQYGRKDPFPASHTDENMQNTTQLYDIEGKNRLLKTEHNVLQGFPNVDGGVVAYDCVAHEGHKNFAKSTDVLDYSVMNPDVYIVADGEQCADWLLPDNPYYVSNWNHNNTTNRDMKAKSLFDPCPLGWRVHRMGAMMIFSKQLRDPRYFDSSNTDNPNSGNYNGVVYINTPTVVNGISVNDRYYYHGTLNYDDFNIKDQHFIENGEKDIFNGYTFYIAGYGDGPTAYYPRTNHRLTSDGFLVVTEDVCNWSIDGGLSPIVSGPNDNARDRLDYAYHLDFYSYYEGKGARLDMPDSAGKAYGLAVRCIKETADMSH